jgi:phage shock protein PspC (stress-responsive transcriptional regulator)
MSRHPPYEGPFGLQRDTEYAVLFGVCAGVAARFRLNRLGVRILALVLLVLFTLPTAVGYLMAALMLPKRNLRWRGRGREEQFWRQAGRRAENRGEIIEGEWT